MTLSDNKQSDMKNKATIASILTALTLIIIKAFAALVTGSLSILSSMVDSMADILASSITFIAVHYADKPLTQKHRYGYGKAEAVSALIQAAFITGSAGFILYDGLHRFSHPVTLDETTVGLIVMIISLLITSALIIFQKKILKQIHSQAIRADNWHYVVDLISNSAVILSLLLIKYLDWMWIDVAVAALIAMYLIYCAGKIAYEAMEEITDKEIDDNEKQKIISAIMEIEQIKGWHDFRSRFSGNFLFIEIHLEFDGNLSLYTTHEISDKAEEKITSIFPQAQVIIHQDPHGLKEKRLDHDIDGSCAL